MQSINISVRTHVPFYVTCVGKAKVHVIIDQYLPRTVVSVSAF